MGQILYVESLDIPWPYNRWTDRKAETEANEIATIS